MIFAALLFASATFCFVMALHFFLQARSAKHETEALLERYVGTPSSLSWSDQLVERLDKQNWAKKLEPQLKRASIKLRPAEYGAAVVGVGLALVLILKMIVEMPLFVALLASLILTPLASKFFLNSRKFIYVQRINAQLSEVCRLLSSTARAGLSIQQGLEVVAKEMASPVKDELSIVVQEQQLGRDLEVSLRELLKRVPSKDLEVFVNALIIQRRAGGDLAKVLAQMASTMEERKIIHKTIDATVAQSRYTAYVLPFLSILIVFVMGQLMEGFYDMFTSFLGIVVLIIFVVLQVVGFLLVKKISDIRV